MAKAQKLNKKLVLELYNQGLSPYEIAEKIGHGCYPNKIRRFLKKITAVRGRSESQKNALKSGRRPHPTKGKKFSDETKLKMGKAISDGWSKMDEEKYNQLIQERRELWNNRSDEQKRDMQDKAIKGLKKAAREGSSIEKYISAQLKKHGFIVQIHRKDLLPNFKLEVDMFIPNLGTAIEIDGPSHYEPIFGEEKLKEVIAADNDKNGLLLVKGFVVIRIKCLENPITLNFKKRVLDLLIEELNKIKQQMPPKNKRLIKLEP